MAETLWIEKLAELEKLCDAATPGPWFTGDGTQATHFHGKYAVLTKWESEQSVRCVLLQCNVNFKEEADRNGEFIAAARTALPEAIAEIRRLELLLAAKQSAWRNSIATVLQNPDEIGLIGTEPHLEIRNALRPVAEAIAEIRRLTGILALEVEDRENRTLTLQRYVRETAQRCASIANEHGFTQAALEIRREFGPAGKEKC